ncbi:hypothetical protein DSCO28_73150 (plasmid) [Desulfosarcina ovata subsp. sediminis]|uniref:Uncharacterized protein n=1 Tax=Desulfosarcina ovata subsp. sediminis TaxID=885957 RepID=A0A5K8A2I5_9BACT|nr:hypothetical protein DSCO28_73150 [Desulfosarcina ovata subsp. sediminis]
MIKQSKEQSYGQSAVQKPKNLIKTKCSDIYKVSMQKNSLKNRYENGQSSGHSGGQSVK